MPNLKFLSLFNNNIIKVTSLIKCFILNPIDLIVLDWNPITSLNNRQDMRRININK